MIKEDNLGVIKLILMDPQNKDCSIGQLTTQIQT